MDVPSEAYRVAIVIPAAGGSSRMRGRDKLMMPVKGEALLKRQVRAAVSVAPTWVTIPDHEHRRAHCLMGLGAQLIAVPDHAEGISASLRRGMAALPRIWDVLVMLPDLPQLTAAHLRAVIACAQAHPRASIVRATDSDKNAGHPTLFRAPLIAEFAALTGDTGAKQILKRHQSDTVLCPLPGDVATFDLDTPAAWARWQQRLRSLNLR